MMFSKLTDYELAVLGKETYDKQHWSAEDIRTLRECWGEYQRRGEDMMALFRPAYLDVLSFHEVESGEVDEERVQMYERTGAEIALDYREIMRKLRGVDVAPHEEPNDLPDFDESEALENSFGSLQRKLKTTRPIVDRCCAACFR